MCVTAHVDWNYLLDKKNAYCVGAFGYLSGASFLRCKKKKKSSTCKIVQPEPRKTLLEPESNYSASLKAIEKIIFL